DRSATSRIVGGDDDHVALPLQTRHYGDVEVAGQMVVHLDVESGFQFAQKHQTFSFRSGRIVAPLVTTRSPVTRHSYPGCPGRRASGSSQRLCDHPSTKG